MHSNSDGPAPRVLLVDDAPDNRLMMSLFLRRSGVEILTARNGEEALQVTASMGPDLVILDFHIAGMSGFEVCKRIKTNPATAHTPVIFLAADEDRDNRIKGLQVGADDFFSKPVRRDEFLVRVKSLVGAHKARRQLEVPQMVAEAAPGGDGGAPTGAPRNLMDKILTTSGVPGNPLVGYQTRFDAVILFADLRGFTRIAENRLPYDVVFLLNRYFDAVGGAIEAAGGVANQFTGDGVMALFGLDSGSREGARNALAAAVAMQRAVADLSAELHEELPEGLRLGIGIHCGPTVVGHMGRGTATYLTAVGDAVNTASRLQDQTKAFACQLIISDELAERAGIDVSPFRREEISVRNRANTIGVHIIADVNSLVLGEA